VVAEPLRLIVVRHGETELTGSVYNGSGPAAADPPLTTAGRRRLSRVDRPDVAARVAVASSPALRARQTLGTLIDAWVPGEVDGPEIVEALAEVDFGDWEGRSAVRVSREDPQRWREWLADPAIAPPNGSSLVQRDGLLRAYLTRLQLSPQRTWLLVAHATTVRLVVAQVLGLSLANAQRIGVRPGGWCEVRIWSDGGACLDGLH
jgi:probable phosphoglycerate mutase